MGLHSMLARLRPGSTSRPSPADLDVHIAGVVRPPRREPPWPTTSWGRYRRAHRREPSATARVLLELHPAFLGCRPDNPGWLDLERAELLATEWAMFSPAETAEWLSAHPAVSAQQAQTLARAGWRPRDAALALPERVIVLDRLLARQRHQVG